MPFTLAEVVVRRSISELKPGELIDDEVFLVRSKDLRTTSQGGLYIHAVLVDKSGDLLARMWQASESIYNAIPQGGFVRLKGRTENYKGSLQFIIEAVRIADEGSFDIADFLPATSCDIDEMFKRLTEIVRGIKHPDLAALAGEFLADEDLMARFKKAPAAAVLHHAYIGGLLEHTLSLLELALVVIPRYPQLSLDLVLTGLFLHDIGKCRELTFDTTIGYSDQGQLVGHIALATIWIERKSIAVAEKTGKPFPAEVRDLLMHLILSHHGRYEFGSPKLPAVAEAAAIHYLDNLDAKINQFSGEIDKDRDPTSSWTNYNRALETKVYKVDVMGTRGDKA